jgi:hypothetical protein
MVRNGVRGSKQLYKCKDCGKQFLGGHRRDKSQVITPYLNERTIRRDLEGMSYVYMIAKYKEATIQMDKHKGQELQPPGHFALDCYPNILLFVQVTETFPPLQSFRPQYNVQHYS